MPNDTLAELHGQIERVTYANDESGFTIARLKVPGRKGLVTIVGNIVNPVPGEVLSLKGEWSHHPKYGEQFKIVHSQSAAPVTLQGIERYLGSGLIRGIGPVMAKRIVKRFREATLEVIEHRSARLSAIAGIGPKRIAMIQKAWAEQREIREIMIFLQSHGVGAGYAFRIFKRYGEKSIAVVRENPYRLATDIFGIGFLSADRIAEKLGFARDSALRAEAGILYVLNELTDEGHVYYPREPLLGKCQEILAIDRAIIAAALAAIAADGRIVIAAAGRPPAALAEQGPAVYLARYHLAETQAAARLRVLIETPRAIRPIDAEKAIPWVEETLGITLAAGQGEAIRALAGHKVLVVTGGPGTGKTTIITAMLRLFAGLRARILLAAPTGRAAKRMGEATGQEAMTIHRLLEFSFQKGGFQKDETDPLACDLLIVDEASMIDILLFHHLLRAVPARATFVLVGDVNQLPSVGAGNVLKEIIDAGTAPVVALTEIFRQASQSAIIVNAHRINAGLMPNLSTSRERLEEFYFVEQEDPEKVLELIITLVKERIPQRFGLDPLDDIQVLTPMHRGIVGGMNLNVALQKALNPGEGGVARLGRLYRVGDKVMQIANNYDKEVYNGDIGRITAIDAEGQEVLVTIDGREVAYEFSELDELVHAYAVSIHKSQGSEYPAVVIPLLTQHYILLQRNLLYTGVTRGKRLVVIVGTKKALAIAIGNNKTERRYTLLAERLRGSV